MISAIPIRSLRFKLILASVLVEVLLLTLLLVNSQRLIGNSLLEQARLRVTELNPLLNAALGGPLAERDYATLTDILQESRRQEGLSYLVLVDNGGRAVAAAGWGRDQPLPPIDREISDEQGDSAQRYDTSTPITLAGQKYGVLHYGLSTEFLGTAKAALLQQGIAIAAAEVTLSVLLLSIVGLWLTRHLGELATASRAVASGNLDVNLPVRSRDEVGELTQAFNTMSAAIRQQIHELRAGNARLHAIADYTYGWENWMGPDGKLLWVNPSVERLTGYSPADCYAMADFPLPMITTEDRERVRGELQRSVHRGSGSDFEFRCRRKDGSVFWAAVAWQSIHGENGEFLGRRSSIWDISERKRAELALQDKLVELQLSEQAQRQLMLLAQDEQARLSHLLSAMTLGILFEDSHKRVMYSNPAFRRIWHIPDSVDLTGKTTDEVLRHSANVLSRPDHFSRHILQVVGTHEVSETFEIALADGRVLTQLSYPVRDTDGRSVGRLWIYEDVTRERQTAEQLIYLAERDSLTGLYNRHRFQEELARMLAESERRKIQGALLFFDLDEFKYINDTFGHRAGDAMLIRVAGETGALVRRNEILSRLGGDEFAILLPDTTEAEAVQLAERVIRAVAQIPFRFEQQTLRLTTSLGIALYPQHGTNAEDLIARADTAMYQAKEAGKNAWRVYRPDRDATREMLGRLSWKERIRNAIENNLLRLHFQGVYRARDGVLTHLEVLVRMVDETDPEHLIMPGHFIGYAEKSGKIRDIDRWVIAETIRLLARAPATGWSRQ